MSLDELFQAVTADTVIDETTSLEELFQAVTALLGKVNNSGSVLQLVLTNINIFSLVQFVVEKWSSFGISISTNP